MSDIPADWRGQLDLRAEIARIDRDRAESAKLTEETRKFIEESHKLAAEARKLDRDRWWAPALAITATVASILGIATFIAHLMGH